MLVYVFDWLEQTDKINWVGYFACENDLCRGMMPNYLRTYSFASCQIRALEKAFKKQNNGQSVPKILDLNACI